MIQSMSVKKKITGLLRKVCREKALDHHAWRNLKKNEGLLALKLILHKINDSEFSNVDKAFFPHMHI